MSDDQLIARGLGASPGTVKGKLAFSLEDVKTIVDEGAAAVFVRNDTGPEDVPAMQLASAIVTSTGGLTGDAAIVARALGKPCVAGCRALHVDSSKREARVGGGLGSADGSGVIVLRAFDSVTVDGTAGTLARG